MTAAAELRAAAERLRWLLHEDGMPEQIREHWTAPRDVMVGQISVPGQDVPVAQAFWGGVAEYAVAMQPAVGAALADWLVSVADLHEPYQPSHGREEPTPGCQWCADEDWPCADTRNALAIARAVNASKEQP